MKVLFIFRRDLRTYDNTTLNRVINKYPNLIEYIERNIYKSINQEQVFSQIQYKIAEN